MKLWQYKSICLLFMGCIGAGVYTYVSFAGGAPVANPDPTPGISADVVLGQQNFVSSTHEASVSGAWLSNPTAVYVGGGKTYVADSTYNRILIWDTETPIDGQVADRVLGQADFASTQSNRGQGTPGADTLNAPASVFSDGTRIFVSDQNNYRVLIWNTTDVENGQEADVVLGQLDFTSASPNQGGSVNSSTLYSAIGVFSSGSKIYVADQSNARVLIWNTVTPTNGQGADVVLGQADFDSAQSNRGGGASSSTLSNPTGVVVDDSRIYVADSSNHRVLIWNTVTPTNGQGADVVLGQADFDSAQSNRGGGANMGTLNTPLGLSTDGDHIFVSEVGNHRVLIWNTVTPTNGQDADVVLGQASAVSPGANRGLSAPNSGTMNGPWGVFANSSYIYVADTYNGRVLRWDTVTPTDGQGADAVLGQEDFTSADTQHPDAATLYDSRGVFVSDEYVYVSDASNNRILVYSVDGLETGQEAVSVLGQVGYMGRSHSTGASRLYNPSAVMTDGERLYVADTHNHRVLIWNTSTPASGADADIVLGQANFDDNQANAGGSADADTLYNPSGVFSDGSQLFVVDQGNNRVLIWNTSTPELGTAADIVLGQDDFISGDENKGGGLSTTSSMRHPASVWVYNDHIYVTDGWNRRTLIWNTTDVENGQDADVVIGQPDFASSNSTPNVTTTAYTEGVYVYGGKLFVSDNSNNRVMVWDTATPVTGQEADTLIGSADFESSGGYDTSSTTLNTPSGLAVVNGYVFVADTNNHRVLRFPFDVSEAGSPEGSIYFYSTSSTDWQDIDNWWNDSDHTDLAGRLPDGADEVVVVSGSVVPHVRMDTSGDTQWWVDPVSISATDVGIVFFNLLNEYTFTIATDIIGDVTVSGTLMYSSGSIVTIIGNAEFRGGSINQTNSLIAGNASFYDNSYNYGTIEGDVSFSDYTYNAGSVEGNALFYDDAENSGGGIVSGDAYFDCNTENNGTVGGNVVIEDDCFEIQSDEPTNITRTSIVLRGTVVSTGGENLTSRGFVYANTDDFVTQYAVDSGDFGVGEFETEITGLMCGTQYAFATYGENTQEGDYGSTLFFETLACGGGGGGGGSHFILKPTARFGAIPMQIQDGVDEVKKQTVSVVFDVNNAVEMVLSESSDFEGQTFVPFQTSTIFQLSAGTGGKTVYAKLRSSQGGTLVLSDTVRYTSVTSVLTPTPTTPAVHTPASSGGPVVAPSVPASFIFTRFLSRGSSGAEVLELQKKLQTLGFFPSTITPNGIFGPATQAAVSAFQRSSGIDPLGFVGPATRGVLNGGVVVTIVPSENSSSFTFTSFLTRGSSGVEVLVLQKKLQSLGFFPSTITPNGVFGPATQAAVVAFQKANGIDPFGYVGPATRAVLNK